MNNWIFDMFDGKDEIQKEADLTNQEKEWERKVESNDWIKDAMNIDEAELEREAAVKQAAEEEVAGVAEPFDEVGMIMAFEDGSLGAEDTLRLFSELVKNGHAWSLQGSYGRAAKSLIDQGYLDENGNILKHLEDVEGSAHTAEFVSTLKKTAAFEKGDTCEETIEKDYELRVKSLSDYNLAEMLSEYAALEKGVATLSHNEYKEDALKEVKSGRDSAEKKLLKYLGNHTLLDWKKAFKEMEDSEVKHAAEKDLYAEWKEGKMAWESKTKFEATSEDEKVEQMEGVGKEEEKGQVGKEAAAKAPKCPKCGKSESVTPAHDNKLNKCDACHYAFDDESAKDASKKEFLSKVAFITKTARTFEMMLGKYVELDAKNAEEAMAKAKQMYPDLEIDEVAKQMGDEVNRKFKLVYKKKAYLVRVGTKFMVYMTNVVPINAPSEAQALQMAKEQFPGLDKVTLNNQPNFSEVEMPEEAPASSDVPLPAKPKKQPKFQHASLDKTAASPSEMVEKKVKELIKDKIEEAFAEAPASGPEDFPKDPLMVGEGTPEDIMMDKMKVPHLEPGETPESEVKEWKEMDETGKHPDEEKEEPVKVEDVKDKPEDKKEEKDEDKEASLKTAAPDKVPGTPSATLPVDVPGDERGYHGWKNFETYMVALWLDNDHDMYDRVLEMAGSAADLGDLSMQIKSLVEENEPDLGASVYADLLNSAMSDVDWSEVADHYSEYMTPEAPELAEEPAVKPEEASLGEVKPQASKKEVLKKVAEIDSPWKVVKNEKGEEIIARVAPVSTEKKSKEKDKQHGINSKDLK